MSDRFPFLNLVLTDARRALHRMVVRVLLLLALAASAAMGVSAYATSAGKTVAELHVNGTHPAVMADWWLASAPDESILMIAVFPLLLGGFFGGAAVAGAEWRAGTVATLLTFEPRRARLHAARLVAGFVLAAGIAFVLQGVFLGAAVPASVAHGMTGGLDVVALLGAMTRISLLTGATVLLGVSLATLGRNTAFALGVVFAWMAAGEGLIRSLKPGLGDYLLGENLAVALTWAPLEGADFGRSEVAAAATVAVYVAVILAVSTMSFVRRDIQGAS